MAELSAARPLDQAIRRFALRLRRHFASEIGRDPRAFKRRAVAYFRRLLPPGPGRPCDEAVSRAENLRRAGRPWREIYPLSIAGFAALDSATRQLAASRLRSALRSRRNARRRRKGARVVLSCSGASLPVA